MTRMVLRPMRQLLSVVPCADNHSLKCSLWNGQPPARICRVLCTPTRSPTAAARVLQGRCLRHAAAGSNLGRQPVQYKVNMRACCSQKPLIHLLMQAVLQGKYLLQAAAGSSLGRQLIQYARHVGVKTINVVRREEQVQQLKELG